MSIRIQVIRGGIYLSIRQVLGLLVGVGGVILLANTIGPGAYGLYSAAFGFYLYIYQVFQLGIGIYLVRSEKGVQQAVFDQAFCCLLILGVIGILVGLFIFPIINLWVTLKGLVPISVAILLTLPLHLLSAVPTAIIERTLDYRYIAAIEVAGQTIYYLIALPLAYQGFGAWAPVVGFWAQQIAAFIMLLVASKYRPHFIWDWALVGRMVKYGLSFSSSIWVWQLRSLVNPLVVGRFLGAESVGYVAFAIRMIEALSFIKDATWRLSIATMAKIQNDKPRLARIISEGMLLQVMLLGMILIIFIEASVYVFPFAFSEVWLSATIIFSFLAMSCLTNSLFNLHSSALYVLKRNWEVTIFHSIHILLFAGSAIMLIPHMGLLGYGMAELVALPSYCLIYYFVRINIGSLEYVPALIAYCSLVLPLFNRELGLWTFIGIAIPFILPSTRKALSGHLQSIKEFCFAK